MSNVFLDLFKISLSDIKLTLFALASLTKLRLFAINYLMILKIIMNIIINVINKMLKISHALKPFVKSMALID